MKTLKFILQKIVIVEVMLIVLYLAKRGMNIVVPGIDNIIETILRLELPSVGLTYLTPVAVVALVGYIILSLLSFKIIEIALGVVLGGVILYYLFNH